MKQNALIFGIVAFIGSLISFFIDGQSILTNFLLIIGTINLSYYNTEKLSERIKKLEEKNKKIGVIYNETNHESGWQETKTLIKIFDTSEEAEDWVDSSTDKNNPNLKKEFVGFFELLKINNTIKKI